MNFSIKLKSFSISVFALSTYINTPSERRTKIFAPNPPIPLICERLAQIFKFEPASFSFVPKWSSTLFSSFNEIFASLGWSQIRLLLTLRSRTSSQSDFIHREWISSVKDGYDCVFPPKAEAQESGFWGEIVGWRARSVRGYAEWGNGDRNKNFNKKEKTAGFQP